MKDEATVGDILFQRRQRDGSTALRLSELIRRLQTDAKRKPIDYACQRFGGSAGEVYVYGKSGGTVRKIVIDVADNILRAAVVEKIISGGQIAAVFMSSGLHDYVWR